MKFTEEERTQHAVEGILFCRYLRYHGRQDVILKLFDLLGLSKECDVDMFKFHLKSILLPHFQYAVDEAFSLPSQADCLHHLKKTGLTSDQVQECWHLANFESISELGAHLKTFRDGR